MSKHREPLTPEEAALAQRLARLGPHGEPTPALDARVLAAARAADEAPARRRRNRWPAALGLAASIVLAVGIAWQLRPEPGPRAEAPAPAPQRNEAVPGAVVPPPTAVAAHVTADTTPLPPAEPATPSMRRDVPPASKPAPAAALPPPPPHAETPVVFDDPAPMASLPAPPPPLPAAPASPTPQAKQAAAVAEPRAASAGGDRLDAVPSATTENQAFDAAVAADRAADEPDTDIPPATADAPAVRMAWLERIRELVAAGEPDAARASLREFVRRHPDEPVPDDLRPLLR